MSSLGDLIHYVRNQLTGLGGSADSVTSLVRSIGESDLAIPVKDAAGLQGGSVIEIDTELIRLEASDVASGVLTAFAFGRGYRGTGRAAHAAGAEVTLNPVYSTGALLQEINGVLSEIYPRVYGVKTVDLAPGAWGSHVLPDDAVGVVSVWVKDPLVGTWVQERDWNYDPDHRQLSTRWFLSDHDYRIVYATRPRLFGAGDLTQDFSMVTGLDERLKDLLAMGVAVRLAPMVDVARLAFATAEARDMGDSRGSGAGSTAARLLYSMFQARVDNESAILAKEHPIKTNRTR